MYHTYHEAPRDLNSCTAYYSLNPGESGEFDFYLNKAAQVIRRDQILITACQLDYIAISPSKTVLEFNRTRDCYVGTAFVTNTSQFRMEGRVTGKFELINTFKAVYIKPDSRRTLLAALKQNPIAREVLDIPPKLQRARVHSHLNRGPSHL